MKRVLAVALLAVSACTSQPLVEAKVATPAAEVQPTEKEILAGCIDDALGIARMACARCVAVPIYDYEDVEIAAVLVHKEIGPAAVVYNESVMLGVLRSHGRSAVIGVFAHEYGHILMRSHSQVKADAWAGVTLRLLGYKPQSFVAYLKSIIEDEEEVRWRELATWGGWHRANDMMKTVKRTNKDAGALFPNMLPD